MNVSSDSTTQGRGYMRGMGVSSAAQAADFGRHPVGIKSMRGAIRCRLQVGCGLQVGCRCRSGAVQDAGRVRCKFYISAVPGGRGGGQVDRDREVRMLILSTLPLGDWGQVQVRSGHSVEVQMG